MYFLSSDFKPFINTTFYTQNIHDKIKNPFTFMRAHILFFIIFYAKKKIVHLKNITRIQFFSLHFCFRYLILLLLSFMNTHFTPFFFHFFFSNVCSSFYYTPHPFQNLKSNFAPNTHNIFIHNDDKNGRRILIYNSDKI